MKVLLTALVMALAIGFAGAEDWQMGDVDHSGTVTCVDAQLILDFVVGNIHHGAAFDSTLADVSGKDGINAYDSSLLQQQVGGCDEESTGIQTTNWADVKRAAKR